MCVCVYIYIYTYFDIYIHTYTHNGILLSHKKEGNFAICSNTDGHRGHYVK